jgi:hypothetical protein
VDDLQEIAPSAAYPLPRPFGKGTLILPFLVINEYLRQREVYRDRNNQFTEGREGVPDSELIREAVSLGMHQRFGSFGYRLVINGSHKMLLVGSPELLDTVLAPTPEASPMAAPRPLSTTHERRSDPIQPRLAASDLGHPRNTRENHQEPGTARPRVSLLAFIEHSAQEIGAFVLSEVLNLGLEITRAELIAVVNVSDVLEPRKLERQVASFDGRHEVDVVFHRRPEIPFSGPELLRGRRLRSAFFERNLVPPGAAMFRRAVLRATGLFEPSPDPEYQLWLKAAVAGFSFECIEENLVRSSNVEPRPLPPSESVSQMLASVRARYATEDLHPDTELPARPYVPGEPSHVACFTSSTEEKAVEAVLENYLRSAPPEQGNAFLWLTDSAQATRRFVELYEGICEQIGLAPQTGPPIDVYQVRPQELHSVFRAQLLWAQDVFSSAGSAASGSPSADNRPS